MKPLSEMRIVKASGHVFSFLGITAFFVPFSEQDIKTKILIIGGCVLAALVCWLIDAHIEISKLKRANEDLKKSMREIEKNRKYFSDKSASQQRKIDTFRHEWNIIEMCITSHASRGDKIEFTHLQKVHANSTAVIMNSGGFTDDDESKNI